MKRSLKFAITGAFSFVLYIVLVPINNWAHVNAPGMQVIVYLAMIAAMFVTIGIGLYVGYLVIRGE